MPEGGTPGNNGCLTPDPGNPGKLDAPINSKMVMIRCHKRVKKIDIIKETVINFYSNNNTI